MNKMKKQLAVAVTVALLALPLGSALAQESSNDTPVVVATTTTSTTIATTELQALELLEAAEVAVTAYEAGEITTLAEVTTAEGLKAAAVTAVEAVSNGNLQTALELRVTTRAAAIDTEKTELQALELLEAAEVAVTAYEAGEITTLTEVATAEGLKAAAVTAVEAVSEVDVQTALELRVTTRAAAIDTAKTTLSVPVVDPDGKIVIPSTQFSDFIDKLQLALAFDPVHKGELTKRHALRKLAQAQKLMKDGNVEASKICFAEYKDKIAKAQAFLLEVEDTDSETAKALAEALVKVEADNVQVLTNLVDKIPPQAAQKLALNVVRTMEKAVVKIQEEEVAAIPVVTPVVTPAVIQSVVKEVKPIAQTDSEKKYLEKQAKTALEEFKRSVNAKEINQKAKDDQCTAEQKLEIKEKWETQKNIAPTYRTSDNNKDDHKKQDDHQKDNGGDNRRDHN